MSWFKSAVVTAESPSKMHEVVDKAIADGMRMNGCYEEDWSLAESVILGMHLHKFKKGDQKKIMRKLMLRGAEFDDRLLQNKLIGETYNELQKEVQPQLDKQLEERRKVGESAVRGGSVVGVEIDNKTSITEFSEDSTVEVAKVVEGTKSLGLNKGCVKSGSHIIRIGDSEVEIRNEQGGERNYTDISDNSAFEITFSTSIGSLRIEVYHQAENDHQVEVRVVDKEM